MKLAMEETTPVEESSRKLKILRLLAFLVVPLLFIGFLTFGLFRTAGPKARIGQEGPNFSLPLLGAQGRLDSRELRGKPVVVNFWASWCIPCREEASTLETAWTKYRDKGVQFVGINVLDTEKDALDFVNDFGITYPMVRDVNQQIASRFGVVGIPETFFLDERYRFVGIEASEQIGKRGNTVVLGAISSELLVNRIEELLRTSQ